MVTSPKQVFFSSMPFKSLEEFWDNQALLPGYQGVVIDTENHISTQMLYNFISTQLNIKDEIVLDVGCGVGRLFPIFIEFGAKEIHGIDISMSMLRIARFKYPQPNIILYKMDISDTKIFNNFKQLCSLTVCITTLCHIIDDTKIQDIILYMIDRTSINGTVLLCEPMSVTSKTFYQHSNMTIRPLSFYSDIFDLAPVDLIYNHRECFGPLDHVDSFRQVMVYKKKEDNASRKQRKQK